MPLSCTASAPAQTYTITAEELNALDSRLQQQKKLINSSKSDLIMLRQELAVSQTALQTAQLQLAELTVQLNESQKISQAQSGLFKSANQSLQQYAAEVKRKERIIKHQRNIAYGLLAGLIVLTV